MLSVLAVGDSLAVFDAVGHVRVLQTLLCHSVDLEAVIEPDDQVLTGGV
jgi:hypothetical protein